jgi:hypothetical protein
MANRFIGGVLSSRPQANTPFSSRASTGTYFDSAGVLRTAPINQPRLNYNLVGSAWTQPAVLLEPETTNIIPYSQDFTSGAGWGAAASTITSNTTLAPDGTTTASSWILNSGSSEHYISRSTTLVDGRRYTYSIYAKPAGKNWIILNHNNYTGATYTYFNISTGSIGTTGPGVTPSIVNAGNGWYRCAVTITHSTALYGSTGPQLYMANDTGTASSFTGDGVSGVYIWGAQMETNFGTTSYIPTSGSTVTRAADVVGPGTSGIYGLEDRQNTTAIDDQFTVQSFTTTGSTAWTAPLDVTSVEVLVVAGGGAGGGGSGAIGGGGGGAGGIIYNTSYPVTPGTTYPIVVGDGGVGALRNIGTNGGNSQFGALVARGGGAGASDSNLSNVGTPGGSGGGGGGRSGIGAPGIAGQGYPGSNGAANAYYAGGAGGGAGGPATPFFGSVAGSGGPGLYFNISGTSTAYGGGGGGGGSSFSSVSTAGSGGVGGGGAGTSTSINGNPGTANTGGGGGASGWSVDGTNIYGGNGGSGIVIVKYKRTPKQITSTSNAAIVTQKFTVNNTWTVPTGVTQVEVLVVAGGGGAGGGEAFTGAGGGGGAGGVVYSSMYSVIPNGNCSIVVGNGGTGGTANSGSGDGSNGSNSLFATSAANIVTNGSFDTDTGWAHTLTSIANGYMYLNAGDQPRPTNTSLGTATGSYLLTWTVISNPSGHTASLDDDGAGAGLGSVTTYVSGISAVGTYSAVVSKTASTRLRILGSGTFTSSMVFDNVFMYPVSGTINAIGGGAGGRYSVSGYSGGSGGGGGNSSAGGGSASQPASGSGGFGNAGAVGATYSSGDFTRRGGGGGGAGSPGIASGAGFGGAGGAGIPFSITGNLEYYAGGGGGGYAPNAGGIGGGGTFIANGSNGSNGAPNSGGGGGGSGSNNNASIGGNGGSGVVIIRYRVPQIATFLDSGSWTCPAGVTSVQALIVAGGGGGGSDLGGGGGGGGVVYDNSIPVTPGVTYPIVVGQGGTTTADAGNNGQNSNFANIIAIGGGGGGSGVSTNAGRAGGSGGGARVNRTNQPGGSGVYAQGNAGGGALDLAAGTGYGASGGGGGAGGVGAGGSQNAEGSAGTGNGGIGLAYTISGTSTYYGGGGAGAGVVGTSYTPQGGLGGGGGGVLSSSIPGLNATANTGGGGGGGGNGYLGGQGSQGGSGIVILRWSGA